MLDIRSPRTVRVNENCFQLAPEQCFLRITDTNEAPAGPVTVTDNFISGSEKSIKRLTEKGEDHT